MLKKIHKNKITDLNNQYDLFQYWQNSNLNKIFKKGKSEVLTFKNNSDNQTVFGTNEKRPISTKTPKIKKLYIGKGEHYFPKSNIGQFLIEENEINIGNHFFA